MKVYRGAAAAARHYVEADRSRADDYYLAEGTGLAERYMATPDGVRGAGTLSGESYEAWVAGYDPATGDAKGRLRTDDHAVRFVEVVVNGPKTWSLAAAVDPEISRAYDAAQDRAATQIIGWLAEHATTRVGPRGRQAQVPVQGIEAAVVRHYTSRTGDPHRHLHLQVNARVFAAGRWRGLHTVGVRDSLEAINGIGHAAMMTDPGFRSALAARGYTLETESGEIVELAGYAGAFSARAAQIGRNVDRYEAQWRTGHPGVEPGPALRRSWDARAWAEARPDKVVPRDGTELAQRWVQELTSLGFVPPKPAPADNVPAGCIPHAANVPDKRRALPSTVPGRYPIGALDRDAAVSTVLSRLGARRSGWNAADVRGEVEQLLARTGLVTQAGVRLELAEDLTARTLRQCVPLLEHPGAPEHIRALTSRQVVEVEADLTARLVARAHAGPARSAAGDNGQVDGAAAEGVEGAGLRLDTAQRAVVTALAGDRALLVVEGAAGSGKTTTLAAARSAIERWGHELVVVAPTRKAAEVATRQLGSRAASAAWLVHQHGYRRSVDGAWTRLCAGETDPATGTAYDGPSRSAVLANGDVLLVDEAGMVDQDIAHALLAIADEAGARVALVGDRHQLPAVGRGGVLDLAARWAHPDDHLTLEAVQRFTDPDYARLSLAMRAGQDPGQVFDALRARGDIVLHASEAERIHALAGTVAGVVTDAGGERRRESRGEGGRVLVVADTREEVASLNAAVRDRLVAAGRVDDENAVTTTAGERVGVGDRVATRRNDRGLDVANRETWTVTGIGTDATLTVTGRGGQRSLPATYARENVELAYASTVYGAQGETVHRAHLVVGEHTSAAAAYVAMTRGRAANTAHLIAESVEQARDQWVEAFGRDRADLGPAHAAALAATEAARYAPARPLQRVLADLRDAWTCEADLAARLTTARDQRDRLAVVVPLRAEADHRLSELRQAARGADEHAASFRAELQRTESAVDGTAGRIGGELWRRWQVDYPAALQAAQTIRTGPGRLGLHRAAVRRARADLHTWTQTWRPVLPDLPVDLDALAGRFPPPAGAQLHDALSGIARRLAEAEHPEHAPQSAAAAAAQTRAERARDAYRDELRSDPLDLARFGYLAHIHDPADRLERTARLVDQLTADVHRARARVQALECEPALRSQPPDLLWTQRAAWESQREQDREAQRELARARAANQALHGPRGPASPGLGAPHWPTMRPDAAPGISR